MTELKQTTEAIEPSVLEAPTKKKNWVFKLGLILIIVSIPLFLAIPVVPFLHLAAGVKVTITTVLLVSGEVLFWSGGLLVGKELFTKYKAYLNPVNWFKKKNHEKTV